MKQFLFVTLVTLGTVTHAADAASDDELKEFDSKKLTEDLEFRKEAIHLLYHRIGICNCDSMEKLTTELNKRCNDSKQGDGGSSEK